MLRIVEWRPISIINVNSPLQLTGQHNLSSSFVRIASRRDVSGIVNGSRNPEHLNPAEQPQQERDHVPGQRSVRVGCWNIDDGEQLRKQDNVDQVPGEEPELER